MIRLSYLFIVANDYSQEYPQSLLEQELTNQKAGIPKPKPIVYLWRKFFYQFLLMTTRTPVSVQGNFKT